MDKTSHLAMSLVAGGNYETILAVLEALKMKPTVHTQETDRDTVIQAAKLDAQQELIVAFKDICQAYLPN